MSDNASPFNPYTPPTDPIEVKPTGATPTGLKVVCIFAIILGGLGLLGVIGEVVTIALGEEMQRLLSPEQPGMNDEMRELQREMQSELQKITDQYVIFTGVSVVVHLVSAVTLLAGGVMTLNISAKGRSLLLFACGLSAVYVLGATILHVVVQLQTVPVVQEFTDGMMRAAPQNQQMPEWLSALTTGMIWGGIAFAVVMAVVKIFYYLFSVFYLRKPHIAARFQD